MATQHAAAADMSCNAATAALHATNRPCAKSTMRKLDDRYTRPGQLTQQGGVESGVGPPRICDQGRQCGPGGLLRRIYIALEGSAARLHAAAHRAALVLLLGRAGWECGAIGAGSLLGPLREGGLGPHPCEGAVKLATQKVRWMRSIPARVGCLVFWFG